MPRWYYDAEKDNCVRFIYEGKGGNGNRFMNHCDCIRRCTPYNPIAESKACSATCKSMEYVCISPQCKLMCPDISPCVEGGGAVIGDEVYSGSSLVCRAAVHAGVIPATGGAFTMTYEYPGHTRVHPIKGTTRNKVVFEHLMKTDEVCMFKTIN
jgi:hypothetical protein